MDAICAYIYIYITFTHSIEYMYVCFLHTYYVDDYMLVCNINGISVILAGKNIELLRVSQRAMVDCGRANLNDVFENERGL